MLKFRHQRKPLACSKLIGRSAVSCIFVFLTQFAISLVPRFFATYSIAIQLALSALVLVTVLGSGRWCRRLLGVSASAPALVVFNILFIWGVYIVVIRQAVSQMMDVVFNGEVLMLIIGLCSIMSSDPGYVRHGSSCSEGIEAQDESSLSQRRIRYCKSCKAYIRGFDHHCPAFGNCIGKNNYIIFILLLLGFLTTEVSYLLCSTQFTRKSKMFDITRLETSMSRSLAISTMLFSLLQVLWQINWTEYPEFQSIPQSLPGESFTKMMFKNPYDKGVLQNVVEFLTWKG